MANQPHTEPQVTDLGKIEIAPEVLQIIAGLAALQVDGVLGTSGGVVSDITQFLGRKNPKQGIRVELEEETKIVVSIIVEYGKKIPEVGLEVQARVKEAVENMTGLPVSDVIVRVVEVKFRNKAEEEGDNQRLK
jgi:uncharacterized alkaline shock family protein YloU